MLKELYYDQHEARIMAILESSQRGHFLSSVIINMQANHLCHFNHIGEMVNGDTQCLQSRAMKEVLLRISRESSKSSPMRNNSCMILRS